MNQNRLSVLKRWWQVSLLFFAFLIGGSSPTWAGAHFGQWSSIQHHPTVDEPFIVLKIMFYDTNGYDAFFMHDKTDGGKNGPAIYVDGHYIDSPDWELAWPGSGDGGDSYLEKERGVQEWWGNTYSRTVNGITYTIKFWDPGKSPSGNYFTTYAYIFISKLHVGETHTVKIKGTWRINSTSTKVEEASWTTNKLTSPYSSGPSATMSDYTNMTVSGVLNPNHGTTWVGTTNNVQWGVNTNPTDPGSLNNKKDFGRSTSSYSALLLPFARNDYYNPQSKPVEYVITEKVGLNTLPANSRPDVNIYQWYNVSVPGFVRASEVTADGTGQNLWDKKIVVSWKPDESGNRSKNGTWSVYRDGTLLASGIDYGKRSYEDTSVPEYDKEYKYKVVFVPSGSPSGATRSELSLEATGKLERPLSFFSNEYATDTIDDKIVFSWSHPSIMSASGSNVVNMTLERSSDKRNWSTLQTLAISSPDTTSGSYEDVNGLQTFTTYYYRLRVNVLGKNYESTPATGQLEGMSKVTDFSATRGTYSNMVKLRWMAKQIGTNTTYFTVYRRPLGSADENDWAEIYSTSGTAASYSYDDVTALPGSFNEYKVSTWMMNGETPVPGNDKRVDGFNIATGVVSGRITYGTGTAVSDAKVILKQQTNDGSLATGMHSLLLDGINSGLTYQTSDKANMTKLFANDFTVQMYLWPDSAKMSATGNKDYYHLFNEWNLIAFRMQYDGSKYSIVVNTHNKESKTGYIIPANQWSHISFVYKKDTQKLTILVRSNSQVQKIEKTGHIVNGASAGTVLGIMRDGKRGEASTDGKAFGGFLDEFRFFSKALTEKDIEHNYNHTLAGNEDGLAIYYPLDEGIPSQSLAYDFSKTNGVANGHHAIMEVPAKSSTYTPSEEQLSLMAYTDIDGNYTIRGVPFAGEGTSYTVTPVLNIHKFAPSAQSRFISMSSLNHSGVDFEDISSFPVSGKVVYSGTDYPVGGVNFAVDGVMCTKDGQMIASDEESGEFTISVPIGAHYITLSKNGHVFANGRYPADPLNVGTRDTFKAAISGLEFRDTTLVNFTGRVVGGDIEIAKNVGFGLSENNIGVTQIVLTPTYTNPRMNVVKEVNGAVISYQANKDSVPIPSATDAINSTSWRGKGAEDCRKLIINTDPKTGEFSALVPPLMYQMADVKTVVKKEKIVNSMTIDLTNPMHELSDTLHTDTGDLLYTYHYKLAEPFHSEPVFNVRQNNLPEGLFGISSKKYKDAIGEAVIPVIDNNTYKFGHPLFVQGDPYIFLLEGYEQYNNYDQNKNNPVVSKVPLKNTVVTIGNALSDDQTVFLVTADEVILPDGTVTSAQAGETYGLKSNQIKLDSLGCAAYKWKAGLPNVAAPYTRTISMTYDIEGCTYQWSGNGMTGIILGDLPTGNNFVTSGPDKLNMILRDPPGTGSSAEWSTGRVTTIATTNNDTWSDSFDGGVTFKFGVSTETIAGAVVGVGAAAVTASTIKIDSKDDLTTHATMENEGENGETIETSVSVTRAFATSEEPDYVGAYGDLFIGQATNIIFGNARNVGFSRKGNGFDLGLKDVISTGMSFGTTFAYTQGYIEDYLLPNLIKIRNSLLQTTTQDSINSFGPKDGVGMHDFGKNKGNLYFTTLTPDDDDFGKKGTYTVIMPRPTKKIPDKVKGDNIKLFQWCVEEKEVSTDSIEWVNNQIKVWEDNLAFNEKEKIRAYELRNNKDSVTYENFSFNGGASFNYTMEKDSSNTSSWDWSVSAGVLIGNHAGFDFNGWGLDTDIEITAAGGRHEAKDSTESYSTSFSYTLAEEGNDAITVDVYKYGAFSPIFRTRGGQTSNPYEGKVESQYYKKGTTLMEATMQIEVPQIDVDVFDVSDIPTGSAANYTLRLSNASEIGEDVTYLLFMLDETNHNGAQLMMDGKTLTAEGRLIKVPGNQTLTKMLQLRQTDLSILEYDSIGIVFASESQPEDIADTIFINASYVPSSSNVALQLSSTLMNTQTGTNLTLTFSDFDRYYHNLKAFRLQYKPQGDYTWTQLKEYVINKDENSNSEELPKTGSSVNYILPMNTFSDGKYEFRVVSASTYGTSEVYRYSDEITLIKDMSRPRPLGMPEPATGILGIGDELSLEFNENILRGKLTKDQNFLVSGVLNGAEIDHNIALSMQNTAKAAQTEASIALAGKDFSFDVWMNLSGEGTILSHGTPGNMFTVGTDNNGKLVVRIGSKTYTSTGIVPKNIWDFLSLNYRNVGQGGELSATVANADTTIVLFSGLSTIKYQGNGTLTVGQNIRGSIHELLLWDEAHDMATALLNRTKTKNPATRHLIGYWKMNEGEGTTIRDYSLNRHMVMPSETWFMNNENLAVNLDGSHYITYATADLPLFSDDDYALEFWMRGGRQAGEAQLLQMGEVALWISADGKLQLTGKQAYNESAATVLSTNAIINDNAWHHIALSMLRQGAAAVYVDGERVLTTSGQNVGSISTDRLFMGIRRTTFNAGSDYDYDRIFKGQIDELRVWGATINSDQLTGNRRVRLTGKESGLIAYFPFEIQTPDQFNQVRTVGFNRELIKNDSLHVAQLLGLNAQPASISYVNEAPALRVKPVETNVRFSFTASDNKIVINIDEDAAAIEGTTLNFTVRDVLDENGNYSLPVTWSAFVSRNELAWQEEELSAQTTVTNEATMAATIVNKSGSQQMWTLSGLPEWLIASADYGTVNPAAQSRIYFTVSPATPIGKYQETVYLKGNNGIETPLTVNVVVTGNVPDWTVNPHDYETSMNVIGVLKNEDKFMTDTDDILAAFIGEECRGLAHPEYNQRYDSYFITMDIYGDSKDAGKEVTFRAYDATTGTVYPEVILEGGQKVSFTDGALQGTFSNPSVLAVQDKIEQIIELKTGWNWISFNVQAQNMSIDELFKNISEDVITVKGHNGYLSYTNGEWKGDMSKTLSNTAMYAVKMKADRKLRLVGSSVKSSITAYKGWNWIGYYGRQVASLGNALADLSKNNGDMLKAQRGVAYWDSYEWGGSLMMLQPGMGYKLMIGADQMSFTYPGTIVNAAPQRAPERANENQANQTFNPVNFRNYPDNAIMAAKIIGHGAPLSNAQLGVFAGDECRAAATTQADGIAYLTIPGDEACSLTLKIAVGDQITEVPQTLIYETNSIYGTPDEPMVIDLELGITGIQNILNANDAESVYDLQGRKLDNSTRKLNKGIHIINGKKSAE